MKNVLNNAPDYNKYHPDTVNTKSIELFYQQSGSMLSISKEETEIPTAVEEWLNGVENDGAFIIKNVKHSNEGEMANYAYDISFIGTGLT